MKSKLHFLWIFPLLLLLCFSPGLIVGGLIWKFGIKYYWHFYAPVATLVLLFYVYAHLPTEYRKRMFRYLGGLTK